MARAPTVATVCHGGTKPASHCVIRLRRAADFDLRDRAGRSTPAPIGCTLLLGGHYGVGSLRLLCLVNAARTASLRLMLRAV